MTAKKKITDSNGVQVFPITHTRAVVDDNGNSIEERLQAQTELINEKQMEIGAVPSDDEPVTGSGNWVTSDGVWNAVNWKGDEQFDIDSATVNTNNTTYITPAKLDGVAQWTVIKVDTSTNRVGYVTFPTLVAGRTYILKFNYDNGLTTTVSPYLGTVSGTTFNPITKLGEIESSSTGTFQALFEYGSNTKSLGLYFKQPAINQVLEIHDVSIKETSSVAEAIPKANDAYEATKTVDNVPTENSTNFVSSDGLYEVVFGGGVSKDDTTDYNRNNATTAIGKVYMTGGNYTPTVGAAFPEQIANYPQKYGYKVHVSQGDEITFKRGGGVLYVLLTNDALVIKQMIHADNCVGTIWTAEEDGYLYFNGANETNTQFSIKHTTTVKSIATLESDTTPIDNLESESTVHPLSAKQGKVLAERTVYTKEFLTDSNKWGVTKSKTIGTDYTLVEDEEDCHVIQFETLDTLYGSSLALACNGLTNNEEYVFRIVYDSNKSGSTALKKYPGRAVTDGTVVASWNWRNAENVVVEMPITFDDANPLIGWQLSGMGTNWQLNIKEISVHKKYYLSDAFSNTSEDVVISEEPALKQFKFHGGSYPKGVLSFLHFSDIHSDAVAASLIKRYYDKYSDYIDDVLDGGDDVEKAGTEGIAFLEEAGLTMALRSIGNHDALIANQTAYDNPVTVYNRFYAPYISEWGVTQPANAAEQGLMYWLKDYDMGAFKVRLICIDGVYSVGDYSPTAQNAWLQQALNDTLDSNNAAYGSIVVMFSHYLPASGNIVDHVTYRGDVTTFSRYNVTDGLNNGYQHISEVFIQTVNTFAENGGKVACWLCGHWHADNLYYPTLYKNVLVVNINMAGNIVSGWSKGINERSGDARMCANLVGISPNYLKLYRVGLRSDKWMRPINVLTYDWVNKKVITNY